MTEEQGRPFGQRVVALPKSHGHHGSSNLPALETASAGQPYLYALGAADWKLQGTEGARTFLIMKGFISSDCDPKPSLASLALVLLRIAAPSPASALTGEALHAIAFLLEERRSDVVFDLVEAIDVVGTDVQKILAYAEAEVVTPNDMRAAALVLTRTVEEQSAELSTLTERLGNDLAEVMERAEAVPTAAPAPVVHSTPTSGAPATGMARSYAGAAANGGVPPRHELRATLFAALALVPRPGVYHTREQVDTAIAAVRRAVESAIEAHVPLSKPSPYEKRWWSDFLAELKKESQQAKKASHLLRHIPDHPILGSSASREGGTLGQVAREPRDHRPQRCVGG
ncbi:hypothetical protein B0H11DRAFT_1932070 [Mycena galericulata]|nr:hypothetical protein B0H11DRAFT_1932070 [Mycena galericulata]